MLPNEERGKDAVPGGIPYNGWSYLNGILPTSVKDVRNYILSLGAGSVYEFKKIDRSHTLRLLPTRCDAGPNFSLLRCRFLGDDQ